MRRVPRSEIEAQLERDLALLADLPAALPAPTLVAVVRAQVAREAHRQRSRWHRFAWLRPALGLAAAVALATGLRIGQPGVESAPPLTVVDAEQSAVEWSAALAESSQAVAALLDDAWLPIEAPASPDQELDEVLECLEQSLRVGA